MVKQMNVTERGRRVVIGGDMGGSKTAFFAADQASGELVTREPVTVSTGADEGADHTLEQVKKGIRDTCAKASNSLKARVELAGIGLAIPGSADYRKGVFLKPCNLNGPGFENYPIGPKLAEHFQVPAATVNDANAAALAELKYGVGKRGDVADLALFTLGTGIGGGVVIGGKLIVGQSETGGELGHLVVDPGPDARRCGCEKKGCLEAYIGTRALVAIVLETARGALARDLEKITDYEARLRAIPPALFRYATEGDEFCVGMVRMYARYLAMAAGNVINTVDPQKVVLGGGLAEAGKVLRLDGKDLAGMVVEALRDYAFPQTHGALAGTVCYAELGNNAGAIGAIAYAMQ